MCLVLFNEILMLAAEHFARFDYGHAPVLCQCNTNAIRPAASWGTTIASCGFFGQFCPNNLLPQSDSECFWGRSCVRIQSEDARGIVWIRINLGGLTKENCSLQSAFLSSGSFSHRLFPVDRLTPLVMPILSWTFYGFFRCDFLSSSIHCNFKVVYK